MSFSELPRGIQPLVYELRLLACARLAGRTLREVSQLFYASPLKFYLRLSPEQSIFYITPELFITRIRDCCIEAGRSDAIALCDQIELPRDRRVDILKKFHSGLPEAEPDFLLALWNCMDVPVLYPNSNDREASIDVQNAMRYVRKAFGYHCCSKIRFDATPPALTVRCTSHFYKYLLQSPSEKAVRATVKRFLDCFIFKTEGGGVSSGRRSELDDVSTAYVKEQCQQVPVVSTENVYPRLERFSDDYRTYGWVRLLPPPYESFGEGQ